MGEMIAFQFLFRSTRRSPYSPKSAPEAPPVTCLGTKMVDAMLLPIPAIKYIGMIRLAPNVLSRSGPTLVDK